MAAAFPAIAAIGSLATAGVAVVNTIEAGNQREQARLEQEKLKKEQATLFAEAERKKKEEETNALAKGLAEESLASAAGNARWERQGRQGTILTSPLGITSGGATGSAAKTTILGA